MRRLLFKTELWLPVARPQVFAFFADARNLELVTPPWLNFEILTVGPIELHAGTCIDYRLRIHRIPVRWRTEITLWEPPTRFVDEQRRGPYSYWKHTHAFSDLDGGTLCQDEVEYAVPGGRLVDWLLVRRDIERIFAFRADALRRHFPAGG